MVTVRATDACATRSIGSGRPKERSKNPVTSASSRRLSAPSWGEFGFAIGKFGVPRERARGRIRGCG